MIMVFIKIIVFQALFLIIYDVFLKRETFFNANRAYLLMSATLSLVLPFIQIPQLSSNIVSTTVALPEISINNSETGLSRINAL